MEDITLRARLLVDLLASSLGSSILRSHPNDLGADLVNYLDDSGKAKIPSCWSSWWDWAGQGEKQWKKLIEAQDNITELSCEFSNSSESIPADPYSLLAEAKKLSLLRYPDLTPLLKLVCGHEIRQTSNYRFTEPSSRLLRLRLDTDRAPGQTKSQIGMSPKKEHEVSRMTAYIAHILENTCNAIGSEVRHIVDIGAGQGYLSCSLADLAWDRDSPSGDSVGSSRGLHVLALDSSVEQIRGAERRANSSKSSKRKGTRNEEGMGQSNQNGRSSYLDSSLTFRAVWLGEAPTHKSHPGLFRASEGEGSPRPDLEDVIDEWIKPNNNDQAQSSIPVALVALHACGTLTPSILKKAVSLQRRASNRKWFVAAVVVVGCCYNLLEPEDFPLSRAISEHIQMKHQDFKLTYGHLQLAAQVPSEWLRSEQSEIRAQLAIKKVLYRALITPALESAEDGGMNGTAPRFDKIKRRLGKVNDSAYQSFEIFLETASRKMGFDVCRRLSNIMNYDRDPRTLAGTDIARRIETLQTLRCTLGPAMESLIILDRIIWLWENTDNVQELGLTMTIEVTNVFDQAMNSGRNIAIAMYESRGLGQ